MDPLQLLGEMDVKAVMEKAKANNNALRRLLQRPLQGHLLARVPQLLLLLHARSMKHAQPLIKAVLSMLLALSTLKLHSQIAGPKIPKAHLGAFELESLQKYLALTKLKTTNFERLQVAFDGLLWSPAQWR